MKRTAPRDGAPAPVARHSEPHRMMARPPVRPPQLVIADLEQRLAQLAASHREQERELAQLRGTEASQGKAREKAQLDGADEHRRQEAELARLVEVEKQHLRQKQELARLIAVEDRHRQLDKFLNSCLKF